MPTEQRVFEVELGDAISVGELAAQMSVKAGMVIKELMKLLYNQRARPAPEGGLL